MDESKKMDVAFNESMEEDAIDFDRLEAQLESELEVQMSEWEFLESEKAQIGNPDALGETIKNVVWEQFLNQIAVTAGEDFIEANRGLTLDLSSDAHIQTAENFEYGKLATHNASIDYQEKYSEYRGNFRTDENTLTKEQSKILEGQVKTARYNEKSRAFERLDKATGDWVGESRYNSDKKVWEEYDRIDEAWKKVLKDDSVRKPYDAGRDTGRNGKHNDHQIAAGTIIRDPEAAAYMTQEERVAFATSDVNMHDLDGAANISKSDHDGEKWAKHVRTQEKGNGQTNAEYFPLDEDEFLENDRKAKEEYEKQKKEAEQKAGVAGKQSQKEEVLRIGGKALRAVAMQLLAELIKEIIGKLVRWFKDKKRSLDSLVESLKVAIKSFVSKLKTHLINAGNTVITTIATAIIGPVVSTIKKVWMMLKQGWKSLKDAVAFLKNPENKNMPMSIKVLEVGKIAMAGLSGIGALVLGEAIEKGLMTIPAFAVEIPLLGSLANIIGIFMGAVIAGIIGAIVINLIDSATARKRKKESTESQIGKGNEVLKTQRELRGVVETKYQTKKKETMDTIKARHSEAGVIIRESVAEIFREESKDHTVDFDEIDSALDDLLNS